MSCWSCGSVLVSYTRGGSVAGLSPFNVINFLSLNSANSLKTFRKNSNIPLPACLPSESVNCLLYTPPVFTYRILSTFTYTSQNFFNLAADLLWSPDLGVAVSVSIHFKIRNTSGVHCWGKLWLNLRLWHVFTIFFQLGHDNDEVALPLTLFHPTGV